ncbi:LrgB family protein [Granulicella sp. L46]|jgi:putative effector of murein hydrolase|uniref:LrgB family protein n=1 Tax=Granulicella sp. L46 TaxID=1641865 RepID=UPI00131D7096|nr:LrgB family protein [Granulicella sp. L46]
MNWTTLPHTLSPGIVPLFAIVLTLGAYLFGVEVQKRIPNPLANPVLIAIVIIGITLRLLHLSYQDYFTGAQFIYFLLGPATVALAIPMVRALEHMRRGFWPMISALLAGSLIGLISGYAIVRLLGGSQAVALSMAPKSLTTPIAIAVSASIGGIPSLSAVLAIIGGVLVAISIDPVLRWLKIDEPSAKGLAAGTAGSGLGASRVIPQHTLSAAFAGVAIGANGILTAVLAPILAPLLKHW